MKKFSVIIFIFIWMMISERSQVLASGGNNSSAFSKTALSLSPAIIEHVIGDEPVFGEVTLSNLTNLPIPIKTIKTSFSPREKLEIPAQKLSIFDSSSWINLSGDDTDFILQPKEARVIKYEIVSPNNATPGGHYASLIFQPMIPQEAVSQESVFVFARVAGLFFLQKKGNVIEDLLIKKISVDRFVKSLPLEINLVLKNSGNTHLRPTGRVIIRDDLWNKDIGSLPLPSSIILPGTEKNFNVILDKTNFNKIVLGRYSVSIEVKYNPDIQVLKSPKIYFFFIPWINYLFFGFILIALVLLIYILKKRLIRALNIILHG